MKLLKSTRENMISLMLNTHFCRKIRIITNELILHETAILCIYSLDVDIDQHLNENSKATIEDEKFDINLEDPEVQIAAQKIQAGFRNLMNKKKSDN
jgi:hypothetical protein